MVHLEKKKNVVQQYTYVEKKKTWNTKRKK